ncbi:polysaccharide chain length determinant protein, PEP-CTERM locus subfamily [Marinobacter daqiaonensis]|uniref:Polysaccharide chain length determinant protein, PEP-CTERM locus subfamily n=1 Tax=Marinobacter daqiaonensis TaxID=650891 RepID=A0A1I6HWW3_9GAMM|nr:XrtA system polysaccharide chain length determinant [Marinobacter daqiaonensis]SFR58956.1 polysaccharide chain length determinant protein, PEP-CTERM locus subfamily [Marinobacter daqiaonensis]
MDWRYLLDMANAVKLELYRYRVLAAIIFMGVTAGILALGYLTPKSYTSTSILYADSSSILQPLLRGSAEVTPIDRINEAREMLQSRSYLEQVAFDAGLLTGGEDEQQKNSVIGGLRNALNMKVSNRNFLELSYTSGDPDKSFRVLSSALNRFVERTSSKKRSESQNAFEFIDAQVKTYQRQLEEAEQRLKEFRASNQDGTESNVQTRIERLRSEIENLKLEIQQSQSEVELTREQLAGEQPYRSINLNAGQSEVDRQIAQVRGTLSELRLRYHDSHPDVVSALAQLEELQERKARGDVGAQSGSVSEVIENPVYENLRLKLSEAQTRLEVQRNRLASVERLLEEAFERSERVAANQAELSELTRDYNVTKDVYEDMLQRREKARLSMTLDVEGQGVNYRIQEPASYPTRWDGLQLHQVGMAGPFLGGTMVLGLLVALVMFDNRVRSSRTLLTQLPDNIPVLASIPHYGSSWRERLLRKDVLIILAILVVFMVGYLGVLVFSVLGVEPGQIINRLTGQGG